MHDVSPALFVAGIWGYQLTAALKAALELDLFTAIGQGLGEPVALGERMAASPRGVRILCDFLTVKGFLEKADGRYRLTPSTATFLDRSSPAYMGSVLGFLTSPEMIELILSDPAAVVRAGGSPGLANIAPDNPVWIKFAQSMEAWAAPQAGHVVQLAATWPSPPRKVLDIAASHGLYGIMLAEAFPACTVSAVDWDIVLDVARKNAREKGVIDRFSFVAGSAFDVEWGRDFDLVLLPHFLHHFEPEACVSLLQKIRASLSAGGRVIAAEFVPNPDRVSPPDPAAFAYVMLTTTPRGDAYTEEDYAGMARAAGFSGVRVSAMAPLPQSLVEFV
jgi:predicted O-methyltransferase YrrM